MKKFSASFYWKFKHPIIKPINYNETLSRINSRMHLIGVSIIMDKETRIKGGRLIREEIG